MYNNTFSELFVDNLKLKHIVVLIVTRVGMICAINAIKTSDYNY